MRSTVVQYNSWHTGTGIKWTGKRRYWVEEGKGVWDGRAEGLSAIGDGRQAAISLTPHVDGTGSGSLLDSVLSSSLKKWFSDVCLCSALGHVQIFAAWSAVACQAPLAKPVSG